MIKFQYLLVVIKNHDQEKTHILTWLTLYVLVNRAHMAIIYSNEIYR